MSVCERRQDLIGASSESYLWHRTSEARSTVVSIYLIVYHAGDTTLPAPTSNDQLDNGDIVTY